LNLLAAIHQPEHLPWLGFFHKMKSVDIFVFLDDVQFRKNYFQNRNRIFGTNGPQWVTVPVELQGHTHKTLREMRIDNRRDWRRNYWGSIFLGYKKHPYFPDYGPALEAIIKEPWEELAPLNLSIIELLRKGLGIDTPCTTATTLQLGQASSASEHLVRICQAVGATAYLSGQVAKEYLDAGVFERAGIELRFHEFVHPVYNQRNAGAFVPQLSTFDLLSNCGSEAGRLLVPQAFAERTVQERQQS
jgi:hypothetical protein